MEYKVIVNSSDLVCADTKEVLGVRYLFKLVIRKTNNRYKLLHVDTCLGEENDLVINFCTAINYSIVKGNPIFMRLKDGVYVSNNEYGVESPNSKENLWDMLVAVTKKEKEITQMISSKEKNQYTNCNLMLDILRRKGIIIYPDEVEKNMIGELNIRFLGGYKAWSGDEDICDASILNKNVFEKVESAVKTFNSESRVSNARFIIGEKAYIYFYFDIK